jgi:DNA-binding NtrC family response regulator
MKHGQIPEGEPYVLEPDQKAIVLVVEDETLVRMHGTDILEEAGFIVLEAADAEQAVAILCQRDDVHVLFSDIDMPGEMDGLKLAHHVHARWPKIRLLLTSGHHVIEAAAIPSNGKFIAKPWAQEVLIGKIQEVLRM